MDTSDKYINYDYMGSKHRYSRTHKGYNEG